MLDAAGRQLHDAAPDRQHRDHRDDARVRRSRRSRWSGRRQGSAIGWRARSRSLSRGSGRWARPSPALCSRPPGSEAGGGGRPVAAHAGARPRRRAGPAAQAEGQGRGPARALLQEGQGRRGVRLHLLARSRRSKPQVAALLGRRINVLTTCEELVHSGAGARGGVQGARQAGEAQEGVAARDRRQPRLRDGRARARAHRSLRARQARLGHARGRRGGAQAGAAARASARGSTWRSSAAPSPTAPSATSASSSRRT